MNNQFLPALFGISLLGSLCGQNLTPRPVPPRGVPIAEPVRKELTASLEKLNQAIEPVRASALSPTFASSPKPFTPRSPTMSSFAPKTREKRANCSGRGWNVRNNSGTAALPGLRLQVWLCAATSRRSTECAALRPRLRPQLRSTTRRTAGASTPGSTAATKP